MAITGLWPNKSSNKLYHYTSFKTAIKYILPSKTLRLNPLKKTNDPRESSSFIFSSLTNKRYDPTTLSEKHKEISDYLRSDVKMLCFSMDKKRHFGYEWSRMWAYYGGNHTGLCLELDKKLFLHENEHLINRRLLNKIKYHKHNIHKHEDSRMVDFIELNRIGKEKYLREIFRPTHLEYLLYTKNDEWRSEAEVRLLHFSEKKRSEYCSIKDSLKNIYLGVDFNQKAHLDKLKPFCSNIGVAKLKYLDVRLVTENIWEVPIV